MLLASNFTLQLLQRRILGPHALGQLGLERDDPRPQLRVRRSQIRTASRPALRAPPMDTVATGTPAGICTIDSSESRPSSRASGTGTPITGSGVAEATIPGRWAAPPAPAMITSMPRSARRAA